MTNGKIFRAMFLWVLLAASAVHAAAPFAKGEVIRYAIKKVGIKVGEATLEFKGETSLDGKQYTPCVSRARSAS